MKKPLKIDDPAALAAAKKYQELFNECKAESDKLVKRQEQEAKDFTEAYNREFGKLFQIMAKDALPDPMTTWYKNTHFFDMQYLEHGLLFLKEIPQKNQESDDQPEDTGGVILDSLRKIIH